MNNSERKREMLNLANKPATLTLDCDRILLELLYHFTCFLLLYYVGKLQRFRPKGLNITGNDCLKDAREMWKSSWGVGGGAGSRVAAAGTGCQLTGALWFPGTVRTHRLTEIVTLHRLGESHLRAMLAVFFNDNFNLLFLF